MKPVLINVVHPGGSSALACDYAVIVTYVGRDTGYRSVGYTIVQPVRDRRLLLNAAKAILEDLGDKDDAYGQAATRALRTLHRKA